MLWQLPARTLPVRVRPLAGETVISYSRRLSEANHLVPTAIMRALGSIAIGTGRHLLTRDAWLNEHALDRLETYSGIPRDRLRRALPALRWGWPHSDSRPRELDFPALHIYRTYPAPRPACHACTRHAAQHPNPVPALVRAIIGRLVCVKHRRWVAATDHASAPMPQHDLTAAPEIVTASRRYRRVLARTRDQRWADNILHAAWVITTQDWASGRSWCGAVRGHLLPRWQARAERLGLPCAAPDIPHLVTIPEAVALTELFTDLEWRRRVALSSPLHTDRFHQQVAARLRCPPPRRPLDRPLEITRWINQLQYEDIADRARASYQAYRDPLSAALALPELATSSERP